MPVLRLLVMFTELRIRNFKGWRDTGLIGMAPITLFFGANSSGKSSIGQFLMLLKQTVELSDRRVVFHFGGRESAVDAGSFDRMVFNRESESCISFRYGWRLRERLEFRDPISGGGFSDGELFFEASAGRAGDGRRVVLERMRYELPESGISAGMERKGGSEVSGYEFGVSGYPLLRKEEGYREPGPPVCFYGFPEDVAASYLNADFVRQLNFEHERLFRSLYYLGPLRRRAERLYPWGGAEPESVGYAGEWTVPALLSSAGRRISIGGGGEMPIVEIVALKLREMGLIRDFRVKPVVEGREEFEFLIMTRGSREWVDLPDVGFGISQVLPVLVQCFYAPPGSVVLMEQPEVHLHPAAQSVLADVMIDVIRSREGGEERGLQLIIETHSEHFLRRLQRRIAEEVIPDEMVSVYFANIDRYPAGLERLRLDEFGNILNWPENFFGDEMSDLIAQSRAVLRRREER